MPPALADDARRTRCFPAMKKIRINRSDMGRRATIVAWAINAVILFAIIFVEVYLSTREGVIPFVNSSTGRLSTFLSLGMIAAYIAGLPVREESDSPMCLRCGYPHDTESDPRRCPECGADLWIYTAVGTSRPWRPRLRWGIGIACYAVAFAHAAGPSIAGHLRDIPWTSHVTYEFIAYIGAVLMLFLAVVPIHIHSRPWCPRLRVGIAIAYWAVLLAYLAGVMISGRW